MAFCKSNFFYDIIIMTIDVMKIGRIKKKSQLKHYSINKPIYNNNYLFHYMIITNNIVGLKLTKYPINKMNDDDYDGFMLAAKEGNYNILNYLIKTYPEYIYNKNSMNMTFLHYLSPQDKMYYEIIQNNMIDWEFLFQIYSTQHLSCLDLLFVQGSYTVIKKVLLLLKKIDYSLYQSQPSYFNILINDKLKPNYIIMLLDILYSIDPHIFTYVDDMGYNISFPLVLYNDITLIHYIVKKCGKMLDQYSPISTNHIFIIAYKIGIKTNNYTIASYILNNVMKDHNFDETDINGDNIVFFILNTRLLTKRGNIVIEDSILSRYNDWTKMNINKITILDLIVELDYKTYHKYVKNINGKILIKSIKNEKWKKYINKLPHIEDKNNIHMITTSYTYSNMFQARFTDAAIYSFYLKEKYNHLYMPMYTGKMDEPTWSINMKLPDSMLEKYNNFPWLIIWNSGTNYWIHPHLNELIKNIYISLLFISTFN